MSESGSKQSLYLLSYKSEGIYTYIMTSWKVMKLDLRKKPFKFQTRKVESVSHGFYTNIYLEESV